MPELNISPRRASVAATLILLAALVFSASLGTAPGMAAKAAKCPVAKKKKGLCPKISAKPSYKTVRKGLLVTVPHATTEEGLSEVLTVECPHGEKVLAGGVEITEPFLSVRLSAPNEAVTGWQAQIANFSTTSDIVAWARVFAVCEVGSTV
jgi:hypothetical protein